MATSTTPFRTYVASAQGDMTRREIPLQAEAGSGPLLDVSLGFYNQGQLVIARRGVMTKCSCYQAARTKSKFNVHNGYPPSLVIGYLT